MLDYKDILTKHYVLHMSSREISRQCNVSKSGVNDSLAKFRACEDLDYSLPPEITNAGIAKLVYGKAVAEGVRNEESTEYPDYEELWNFGNQRSFSVGFIHDCNNYLTNSDKFS